MGNPGLSDEELQNVVDALDANGGNQSEAARRTGLDRRTFSYRLNAAKAKDFKPSNTGFELPDFPAEGLSAVEVKDMAKKNFVTRKASYDAHTWFPVKIKDKKPIGILWFGDPHIDDDGCNWPVLDKYADICRETEGLYGANIGDTTNNWVGSLMRKYADQEMSAKTGRKLAEWLMMDSGITWLLWLYGNHDQWGDGSVVLAEMAKRHGTKKIIMHDWEARFVLKFPNGTESKIWAAHDFPGFSQWNPNHGLIKAARFGPDVDLLVCGHKHNWMISHVELADKGTNPLMIRTRGFKFMDDYARRLGITEQEEGCGILTIFNPYATTQSGRIIAFADVEQGANYLTYLRAQHG